MAELVWDGTGSRFYETGVNKGVLYVVGTDGSYGNGVAWNGLTAVTESPTGAEATPLYADNIKYLNLYSAETFEATVEAYTYPPEFAECDGSASLLSGTAGAVIIGQQDRKTFGFCYTTQKENDNGVKSEMVHILYGCKASPSEKAYSTINDSPEAITFSWSLTTTPVNVTGHNPTANMVIDMGKLTEAQRTAVKKQLYGDSSTEGKLVAPDALLAVINGAQ